MINNILRCTVTDKNSAPTLNLKTSTNRFL